MNDVYGHGAGERATQRDRGTGKPVFQSSASGAKNGGFLYDVVDGENGDDISCRPNQVFAISLPTSDSG